jgi:hypothetical protein
MACCYKIDKDLRLVITTAWDVVTFEEARDSRDGIRDDAGFDPAYDELIDARAVVDVAFTFDQARSVARRQFFSPDSRHALVADKASIFGMLRFMGTHHELETGLDRTNVFRDMESALKWLGRERLSVPKGAGR